MTTFRYYQFIFVTVAVAAIAGCVLQGDLQSNSNDFGAITLVTNEGGPSLGYSTNSGIQTLSDLGFSFKDLNQNGSLDKYEDWRLPVNERAADLASQMSIEQIAGLMLYSGHQPVPAVGDRFAGTYDGKGFAESGALPSDLSDEQIRFLTNDNLRHVLITTVESPEVAARWNNNVQALVEGQGLGIPSNNSTDPRHGTISGEEYNAGSGGEISRWPTSLGLAATFDSSITLRFGQIASMEYRALGLTTALSPQVDLATDPRWNRVNGTFGENPQLAADMARAYVDGFQTSTDEANIEGGWGYNSVNAMVKHWPSGGPEEGGRDGHFSFGKFTVYPGQNLKDHLIPFTEGAFDLEGGTGMASAVMPYYTISFGQDPSGKNVGNSYSSYIINDLLRGTYEYDGVVCTDWGVTRDSTAVDAFSGRPWGVEEFTEAERHYLAIIAGVDQFGGNNESAPIIEAFAMGVEEYGEEFMRARMEKSAVRLLTNIFRVGLFENPYLDIEHSMLTVGRAEYVDSGYEAQIKSIVLLKNAGNILPIQQNKKVYVPKRFTPASVTRFGFPIPETSEYPVNLEILEKYFSVTDNPDDADYALVFINSPDTGPGYSSLDAEAGGNGYLPISLQYGAYTAEYARDPSLAGGDPLEAFTNRSYQGKSVTTSNSPDLQMVLDTTAAMNGKPVIVSLFLSNPTVVGEFEPSVKAIVANYGVQDQAIFDILSGAAEPSGLLPMQMPANMRTVEEQYEDVPEDMESYIDSEGNSYDFGFGLNWQGIANDARTTRYK
tara:strand:- start:1554 stop:3881 length:2328 start_codon:yes stop_codon:yes gene_type:complete